MNGPPGVWPWCYCLFFILTVIFKKAFRHVTVLEIIPYGVYPQGLAWLISVCLLFIIATLKNPDHIIESPPHTPQGGVNRILINSNNPSGRYVRRRSIGHDQYSHDEIRSDCELRPPSAMEVVGKVVRSQCQYCIKRKRREDSPPLKRGLQNLPRINRQSIDEESVQGPWSDDDSIASSDISSWFGWRRPFRNPSHRIKYSWMPTFIKLLSAATVIIYGVSPYIGLGTHPSFSTMSNIRTEGNNPNHIFLSQVKHLFPYQNDYITILDTNLMHLERLQPDLTTNLPTSSKIMLQKMHIRGGILGCSIGSSNISFFLSKGWFFDTSRRRGGRFQIFSLPMLSFRRILMKLEDSSDIQNIYEDNNIYEQILSKLFKRGISPKIYKNNANFYIKFTRCITSQCIPPGGRSTTPQGNGQSSIETEFSFLTPHSRMNPRMSSFEFRVMGGRVVKGKEWLSDFSSDISKSGEWRRDVGFVNFCPFVESSCRYS
eukprot:GHVL01031468.1.p1 GENE.GHVL01031468.1~~GHVL01031468.1.p1  ORF type:complete len:540 (+),score=121.83 GHVL01031468.1:162-1622(+)